MTSDWMLLDAMRAESDYRVEQMHKAAYVTRLPRTTPRRRTNKRNTLITRSRRTRRGAAGRSVEDSRQPRVEQEETMHQHPERAA